MASYRYLRDIRPEDIAPEQKRILTPREKCANWLHYNTKWVLLGAALAAVLFYCVYDIFLRKDPVPDYQVAVVGPALTDNQVEALETRLELLADDANGDGQILVQVNAYDVDYSEAGLAAEDVGILDDDASSAASESAGAADYVDPYTQMAADLRLTADFQTADCGIFLVVDPAGFEYNTCAFRYLDGTPSETDTDGHGPTDWYNMVYRCSDCPALAQALANPLGPKTEAEMDIGEVLNGSYYIGFRSAFDDKTQAALADDETFWAKLTQGAVSSAQQEAAS